MMDEATAKTRWCPFVRFKSRDSGSAPAYNRDWAMKNGGEVDPAVDPEFACIGSRCMAWKTHVEEVKPLPSSEAPGILVVAGRCGAFSE